MELPERLAAWLAARGWNQLQLAEKSGKSRALVSQVLGRGKYRTTPSQRTLEAFVAAFGLTMAEFYGPIPKPKKPFKKARVAA